MEENNNVGKSQKRWGWGVHIGQENRRPLIEGKKPRGVPNGWGAVNRVSRKGKSSLTTKRRKEVCNLIRERG